MNRFKWLALVLGLMIATATSLTADRNALLGSWRLVSYEREFKSGGEREYPMGRAPAGYIHFLSDGPMAVVITGQGRAMPTTDQERAGLFNTLVAYAGRYRVEGDKWITTVDISANPALVRTEQPRSFRITGDRLQEVTGWMNRPDNRMARGVLTYEGAR